MISWQARVLILYYRFKNWRQRAEAFDLAKERADIETLGSQWGPKFDGQPDFVDAGGVPAAWIAPSEVVDGRVLIYFHGGGYVVGFDPIPSGVDRTYCPGSAARALMVDYRMAPENPFPAAVEDAVKAYRWAISQGCDPEKIIFAGGFSRRWIDPGCNDRAAGCR